MGPNELKKNNRITQRKKQIKIRKKTKENDRKKHRKKTRKPKNDPDRKKTKNNSKNFINRRKMLKQVKTNDLSN